MSRTSQDILRDAEETLQTARMSQSDLADPERRRFALRNVVVFGRAFTNVLQNLRSKVPNFDEWYGPVQEEMRNDELLRYFYALRSEILKKGSLRISSTAHIHNFNPARDMQKFGSPPAGARSFFMGDQTGGSGWEVELPDGSVEKFYIAMPPEVAESWLTFAEPPTKHKGRKLQSDRVADLVDHYLAYLDGILKDAKTRFGEGGA